MDWSTGERVIRVGVQGNFGQIDETASNAKGKGGENNELKI